MSRRTVRVNFPSDSPEGMIKLIDAILTREGDPTQTPGLDPALRGQLEEIRDAAKPRHVQANKLDGQIQALRQERNTFLGLAKGQTMETEGTGRCLVAQARDHLLLKNRGLEENLSVWGFNVVIGRAKSPVRKPKAG